MLKLDFSLETSAERSDFVNKYMDQKAFYTKKELETIANYILYGKDENGTSCVDRHEVQIQPKHNTYSKKEPESLEALMEMPTFDERVFSDKTPYKHPKPKIDREKDADIPGMKELWGEIDKMQHVIDVTKGKVEDESITPLTAKQLYEWTHWVVDLRRQQFFLKDCFKPVVCHVVQKNAPAPQEKYLWEVEGSGFAVAPLGLYPRHKKRFDDPRGLEEKDYHYDENAKYVLDFRNPLHVYYLLEEYEDLRGESLIEYDDNIEDLIKTIDWYLEKAELTEVQWEIILGKRKKKSNEWIHDELMRKWGVYHSNNYISTIYKHQICEKVAAVAKLVEDRYYEREYLSSWKKCGCCGEWKLKDAREFTRKSRSADGLAPICKKCDKENRKKKK